MHMPNSQTALLGLILLVHVTGTAAFANEPVVPFRWENWEEEERPLLEQQRESLNTKGADVGKVEEVEPNVKGGPVVWLILAGAVGISILAETIVRTVQEWNKCGVIIDATSEEMKIRPHCQLGANYVLVRQANGNVEKIQFEDKPVVDLVEMVKALILGMKGA